MFPHLVQIGPFTLYSFGLLVVLGFLAGCWLSGRLARERGLPGEAFLDAAVLILFASIAGARLLFVLLNWREYSGDLSQAAQTWRGGMSFHGGVVAGIGAGALFMRRRRLPVLPMADAAAPGLALGYAVGRVGCLLNGCCYGGPTHLPWGLHFPDGDPGVLYHPAQVYASAVSLLLMAGLLRFYRAPHRAGEVIAAYVLGYSVYRFGIEAIRKGVTADVLPIGLTPSQVFSLATAAAAVAWWIWLRKNGRPAPEPAPEAPAVNTAPAPG